jgi:ABC-2 type transport system ATP-binding protein
MNQANFILPARLAAAGKCYDEVTALDDVDLEIRRGEVLALLGPNGAGKTTAISLLLGLATPDSGRAELFGQPPTALAARRRVGVMLQTAGLPDTLTTGELLRLTRSYYPNPLGISDCIARAGIGGFMERRYGKLSGGQQRRVQFALALCGQPELLFLDEPTTGLDIDARRMVWAAIRARVADGCGVLLTTHYLEEAEALADRVALLARGRIVAVGSVDEIRARVVRRRIRCVSALAPERIRGWPEVGSVDASGGRMEILTGQAESVVRQLLFEDADLGELEVERAGLAEAFDEITREAA